MTEPSVQESRQRRRHVVETVHDWLADAIVDPEAHWTGT